MNSDCLAQMIEQLKHSVNTQRKIDAANKKLIYKDDWKTLLKDYIDTQFAEETRGNVKQMVDISSNVTKRVIKEISKVYKEPAKRAYIVGEKEDENYKKAVEHIPLNLIWQETNRYTNLMNESLIYVVWRNDRIEYDILTPDVVEVVQNVTDPTKVDALCFSRSYYDNDGKLDIYYVYYDVYGNHYKLNKNYDPIQITGNEDGINPLKDPNNPGKTIIPFIICHRNYPIDSVWDETTGDDLIEGTKIIGALLSYLNYLMKVTTFKQLYFTGVSIKEIPNNLIYDSLYPLVASNPDATIGTVDYSVLLEHVWNIIQNKIGAMANNYGMSLDNFKLTGDAESGYALRIKNIGLEDIINDQIKYFRQYENETFEITKIVYNTNTSKNKIPDDGSFKVDFTEIIYPQSPEEIRQQWKFDISLGAKNIYDYIQFVNPDVKSDDEADALISKNVEINNKVKTDYNISIDTLLETAFKEEPLIK